jgi:hypothetical protein
VKWTPRGVLLLASTGLVVALASGCRDDSWLSEQDARDVAAQAEGPVFYVGTEFAGLPLTHAEKWPEESPIEASFIYGDCEPSGDEPRCTPPLQIQTAVCPNGGTRVGIFASYGFPQGQGKRLVRSLRPVGGGDAPKPKVSFTRVPSC